MITSTHNHGTSPQLLTTAEELRAQIDLIVDTTSVVDVHTHVFPPQFEDLCLFGIDELLTYHYLIAETFRSAKLSYESFWQLSKTEQADLVWRTLFVENSPTSESARGIISVLDAFGLDTRAGDLKDVRRFFESRTLPDHLDQVFKMARVSGVVMTNDPFDITESQIWNGGINVDCRFMSSLRLDGLLNDWQRGASVLSGQGISLDVNLDEATITRLRIFLNKWIQRTNPVYLAVSLPAEFKFPSDDARDRLLREVVLPTAKEQGLSLTLMVGVRRGVNPNLKGAGDGVGKADVASVERLCRDYPDVKFLATFLSRENQHELCVAARKFKNLMPFGCWWFLNNPSIVAEITRERIELLGQSFIPQHSDARVLEQLIYKWKHTRKVIADVLYETYERLLSSGRGVTPEDVSRDVHRLFVGNFEDWIGSSAAEDLGAASIKCRSKNP
jgi:hypothetical protein